jgi:ethanolamine-phosphate cytidylyltransferase
VDDVLIDAPYGITPEMVASLNIAEVVHGTNGDDIGILSHNGEERYAAQYKYPREIGIFTMIEHPRQFKARKHCEKNPEEPGDVPSKV